MRTKILAASAALLLIACNDVPTVGSPYLGTRAASRVTQAVTGDYTVDLSTAGATPMSYVVSARQHADGTADGEFTGIRSDAIGTIAFTGRVTCLAFDPVNHRAWIAGVITENASTSPAFRDGAIFQVGRDIWFRAVDYGEGANDAADRSTTLGFTGSAGINTSADYCALKPWPNAPIPDARTFPISAGNLQVHDK